MSKPYQSTHIVHITDTTDRNAELKVRSAYVGHAGKAGLRNVTVDFAPALNTLDIGIVASELVHNTQRPDRLILSLNCAPPDQKDGTVDNARKDFYCADLGNKTTASGTSNGFEFSYLKNEIQNFFRLTNTNLLKSQFRSLEVLPHHSTFFSILKHRERFIREGILKEVRDLDEIVPSLPDTTHVFEVDNFRNVKLFPSARDLQFLRSEAGKKIKFSFGRASIEVGTPLDFSRHHPGHEAVIAPTLFAAKLGTNVIALSSSSRHTAGHIPVIATIREKPGETRPGFKAPRLGAPVRLTSLQPEVA